MRRGIASAMDRHIPFQRATETSDGFGGSSLSLCDIGDVMPALRKDVNDTERVQAGVFRERSLIRFQVRSRSSPEALPAMTGSSTRARSTASTASRSRKRAGVGSCWSSHAKGR